MSNSNTPLTTRIKIKDQHGNVVSEKEVATYAGLLARAHEEGLSQVCTSLVQVPTEENQFVCIAKADIQTKKGTFTGIGDASPRNVNAKIVPHLIRMAETRAKARALRDAVNIGLVALEELGGDNGELREAGHTGGSDGVRCAPSDGSGRGSDQGTSSSSRSPNGGMTDAQRRLMYRILAQAGIEGDSATTVITEEAGIPLADIDQEAASWLIDRLKDRYGQGIAHGS